MSMDHIVFHLTDADLFDDFMRGLPRQVPLEVARKNSKFRNKHFRGYRFTKNSPDFPVLPSSSVGEESLSPNHPDTSSRF